MSILVAGDFVPKADVKPYDPFSDEIKELFRDSEYVMINLETPLTERGKPILKTGKNFRRSPKYAEILKKAGVDCVCLANNHIRDYGDEGVLDTIRYCNEAGLDIVGAGFNSEDAAKPLIKELGGLRVGFLNYCEREFSIADKNQAGANPFDLIDAYHTIQDLRSKVDKIIVIYHGGIEYQHYPTPEMVKYFRFMIDIGADSVVAHHAHAYSGYECYKGKTVYYGLGNLSFPNTTGIASDSWCIGLMASLSVSENICQPEIKVIDFGNPSLTVNMVREPVMEKHNLTISDISKTISDDVRLEDIWDTQYRAKSKRYLLSLLTGSRLIRKTIGYTNISVGLGTKRTVEILNQFRCDSHRNAMIHSLESSIWKTGDF